jgi:hypothetical protein
VLGINTFRVTALIYRTIDPLLAALSLLHFLQCADMLLVTGTVHKQYLSVLLYLTCTVHARCQKPAPYVIPLQAANMPCVTGVGRNGCMRCCARRTL